MCTLKRVCNCDCCMCVCEFFFFSVSICAFMPAACYGRCICVCLPGILMIYVNLNKSVRSFDLLYSRFFCLPHSLIHRTRASPYKCRVSFCCQLQARQWHLCTFFLNTCSATSNNNYYNQEKMLTSAVTNLIIPYIWALYIYIT